MAKIAVMVGSNRQGSFNGVLADLASAALTENGARVTNIDLAALDLPIYSAHLEADAFPAAARELKETLAAQDGILVVSPEYNGSVTPLLKNGIDWASRPGEGEGPIALSAFRGKASAMMAASISPFGGLRGLLQLRQILATVQTVAIPDQLLVPLAHSAFGEDGNLVDPLQASLVQTIAKRLIVVAEALA